MSEGNNDSLVALPRKVVEQALNALDAGVKISPNSVLHDRLRAALEQPQNHVPDAGNMVPAGWKLVPVEPTDDMLYDIQEFSHILPPRGKRIWAHMLAAAPQPPAVEQPQGEQEPVAWQYRMRSSWGIKKDCWGPWQDCTMEQAAMFQRVPVLHDWPYESRQLYTNQQPPRQPLTDEQLNCLWRQTLGEPHAPRKSAFEFARAIERAHGIGGEG